jgi:hypothetical protein
MYSLIGVISIFLALVGIIYGPLAILKGMNLCGFIALIFGVLALCVGLISMALGIFYKVLEG